jgi:pre-mRNA-splicing factor CDC5/CEF1
VTIDELEGKKRRDLEGQLIKDDIRRHNERKQSDVPGMLAHQQAERGTGEASRRFKMMLPAPVLPESEYAQVRKRPVFACLFSYQLQ